MIYSARCSNPWVTWSHALEKSDVAGLKEGFTKRLYRITRLSYGQSVSLREELGVLHRQGRVLARDNPLALPREVWLRMAGAYPELLQ